MILLNRKRILVLNECPGGKNLSGFILNGRIGIKLKINMLGGKFPRKFFSLFGRITYEYDSIEDA
jgi:hypothetical protein